MSIINQLADLTVTDLDAFRAGTRANWPQISRLTAAPQTLFCVRAGRLKTKSVMLVEVSSSGHSVKFEDLDYITISIPTKGAITSVTRTSSAIAAPGEAFYQDGTPSAFTCAPGYSGYHFNCDRRAYRRFLEAYFGVPMPNVFRLKDPFAAAHVGALQRELQALERELEAGRFEMLSDDGQAMIEDRFLRATLSSPLGGFAAAIAGLSTQRPAGDRALRLAVDFIEEHYGKPITAERIARLAGANIRSLQLAFRDRLGTTLWRYLTMRRLEAVRRLLADPYYGSTVTDAAFMAGFTHLGEFGAQYRARFGESPRATKEAARGGRRAVN